MAVDKMGRLRLLMQAENVLEVPKPNIPGPFTGEKWGTPPELSWEILPQDKEAALQISARWSGGGSSSSDGNYAVRKTVDVPKKKQSKRRKPLLLAQAVDQDGENRTTGDLGPLHIGYCPILAVTKFPYKFMKGSSAIVEKVSWRFFACSRIWDRKWTM